MDKKEDQEDEAVIAFATRHYRIRQLSYCFGAWFSWFQDERAHYEASMNKAAGCCIRGRKEHGLVMLAENCSRTLGIAFTMEAAVALSRLLRLRRGLTDLRRWTHIRKSFRHRRLNVLSRQIYIDKCDRIPKVRLISRLLRSVRRRRLLSARRIGGSAHLAREALNCLVRVVNQRRALAPALKSSVAFHRQAQLRKFIGTAFIRAGNREPHTFMISCSSVYVSAVLH